MFLEKVSKFRVLRLRCQIPLGAIADAAMISHQRLSQIELRRQGACPRNPERLINALEFVIKKKKIELERAEHICKHDRETLFNYVKEGEPF